jgi:DNA adenine methylase
MKTPVSYYGGKQTLAPIILGLIPEHRLYCEPFLGGAAVFFAKKPSKVEVINDTNCELINFYEVLKHDFTSLRTGGTSKNLDNKRAAFTVDYAVRMQRAQIECCDALRIIQSRDVKDAFFYIDPPYVGADQGHYDGYTQEDFDALLKLLESLQGKFLLSSFRNETLRDCIKRKGWHSLEFSMASSMTHCGKQPRKKIEVLTANYPISVTLDERSKKELVTEEE